MDCTKIWDSFTFFLVTLKPFEFLFTYDPTSKMIRSRARKYKFYFIVYLFSILLGLVSTIIFNLHRISCMPTTGYSQLKEASYFISMFLIVITIQICLFSSVFLLNNFQSFRMINTVFAYFGIICGNCYNLLNYLYIKTLLTFDQVFFYK